MRKLRAVIADHESYIGTKCYINDDLTTEERKIQSRLRRRTREGRERGENVKVGYRKMLINVEVWDRSDKQNEIIKRGSKN